MDLRKSMTMLELEARSELALRTAAEFRLQQKDATEYPEEEEKIDHRFPRLAGTRPLSYQKKRAISTRTEKDRKFTLPSIRQSEGWVVEAPRTTEISEALAYGVEPADSSVRYTWYLDHFFGQKENRTFLGGSKEFGPIVLSLVYDNQKTWLGPTKSKTPESPRDSSYKALIRTQDGEDFITFPSSAVRASGLRSKPSHTDILKFIDPRLGEADLGIAEASDKEGVARELLSIEEKQQIKGYKFGVVYCKAGQDMEDDIFGNETGSPAFHRFLETIGNKIRLKEWQHFRAGLDTSKDATGTHSIYTQISAFEVMFHVSTMLPYRDFDKQQLERKRHIGNDIGLIVYREGRQREGYKPTTIESEFNHVLVVVDAFVDSPDAPDDEKDRFAVSVATKESVPLFGPPLPTGPVFKRNDDLRKVILTKLINGEMAALKADAFYSKIRRTRNALYQNVVDMYSSKS